MTPVWEPCIDSFHLRPVWLRRSTIRTRIRGDGAEGGSVTVYSWYDLTWKEQRTVLRLARRGSKHRDPRIARVAEEWAREKLGKDGRHGGSLAEVFFGALLVDGASIGERLRDRRRAKRIMRVSVGGPSRKPAR